MSIVSTEEVQHTRAAALRLVRASAQLLQSFCFADCPEDFGQRFAELYNALYGDPHPSPEDPHRRQGGLLALPLDRLKSALDSLGIGRVGIGKDKGSNSVEIAWSLARRITDRLNSTLGQTRQILAYLPERVDENSPVFAGKWFELAKRGIRWGDDGFPAPEDTREYEAAVEQETARLLVSFVAASPMPPVNQNTGGSTPSDADERPALPTIEYCTLTRNRIRWIGPPIAVQPRILYLFECLLEHGVETPIGAALKGATPTDNIKPKTLRNYLTELNQALEAITFPWRYKLVQQAIRLYPK